MTTWICTHCASYNVSVNLTRPSIDDRYAIGHCDSIAGDVILAEDTEKNRQEIHARIDRDKARRKALKAQRS